MDSELACVLSGHCANPRGQRQPTLSFSARHVTAGQWILSVSRRDVGETTAVNGNPFGDVSAKFSIQPQPCALIIKSRVQLLQLQQLPRRVSTWMVSHAVCLHARRHLSFSFFRASSRLCRIAFFYFIVEKTNFLVPKLRALPRSGRER